MTKPNKLRSIQDSAHSTIIDNAIHAYSETKP